MIVVGLAGVLAVVRPPAYLQALVVFSASAGAVAFLTPVFMACYWRRATPAGVLAAMLGGIAVYLSLYIVGWVHNWAIAEGDTATGLAGGVVKLLGPDPMIGVASAFRPYFLFGLDPILYGLVASALIGITVSRLTKPLPEEHLRRVFDGQPT
jgi:Na+/proline symporter